MICTASTGNALLSILPSMACMVKGLKIASSLVNWYIHYLHVMNTITFKVEL